MQSLGLFPRFGPNLFSVDPGRLSVGEHHLTIDLDFDVNAEVRRVAPVLLGFDDAGLVWVDFASWPSARWLPD